MYDILVYLFENCPQYEPGDEEDRMAKRLSAAGFDALQIGEALRWLAGVARGPHRLLAPLPATGAAFRAYAPRELAKLGADCRGLLAYFEQSGILDAELREHVIERALATSDGELGVEQLKLVILMVLWNRRIDSSRLVAEFLLSPAEAGLAS